jgi:hypothetical protein
MNLALFGYRTFAMGSIVAFIYGTALFGSTYLLPVYMQLGAAFAGLARRHHPAAGRHRAGLTIGGVGRLTAPRPDLAAGQHGLALLAASFALMPR